MDTALKAETKYYWRVRAINNEQTGGWSVTGSFNTLPLPLSVSLTAPINGGVDIDRKPIFEWIEASNSKTYHIQTSQDNEFNNIFFEKTDLQFTSYKNLSLKYDELKTYYWRVRGVNDGGSGAWSDVWSFTVKGTQQSIDDELNSSTEITILPNPVSNYAFIKIDFPINTNYLFSVYDIRGNEIQSYVNHGVQGINDIIISTENISPGIYYCRIIAGKINKTVKFVVIK
jgi:hypothetical protein